METLTADGSNSNDAQKDIEKTKFKLNGEINGSMEVMEVDADSHDSDYKKESKDSYSGDGSNDGSSRMNNGGEHSSESEGEHSGDDSRDVDSSNSKIKNSENSNSHQGFHESMDVDGQSLNSEEEDNLLNSDAENNQGKQNKGDFDPEMMEETEEDEEEDEEEGDINRDETESHDRKRSKGQGDEALKSKANSDRGSENEGKENGEYFSDTENDNDESKDEKGAADSTSNSNEQTPKKKKTQAEIITPRRSSRTVQKPVRFGQETASAHSSEEDEEEDIGNESDEIEEITPQDPLADPIADLRKIPRKIGNTTIVVNDTKRLADIAARNANSQKKEPTLVIIDTNSILSGRGAVPMNQSPQTHLPAVTVTPQPIQPLQPPLQPAPLPQQPHHIKPYPGLPAALPAQGLYPPKPVVRPPPILPTPTDMYVVEAPSFIVPYVYEKPPVKKFKKYLKKMLKQIRKQDEEDLQKEEEEIANEEKEKAEKEKEKASAPSEDAKKETETVVKKDKDDEEHEVGEGKKEVNEKESKEESKSDLKDDKEKSEKSESDEAKVSSTCDSIEDSIKVNEIKKKEDGDVTVKESTPSKKSKSRDKKDGESSSSDDDEEEDEDEKKKPLTGGSYFDNPLGKFFMQIGMNLVQEFVQTDLLKQHKKKQKLGKGTEDTQQAIISLKKNLQLSKENNEPYTMEQNKCDYCSFKTESKLIMAHHLETPHMRNYVYRCNFCPLEVRGPHDILFHMQAEHNIRGRLEKAPAFHQCLQCPFEDNQKGKLTRHLLTCAKKFRPEKNLEPPPDWEPPAKIPRMTRKPNMNMNMNMNMNVNNPLYQQALASKNLQHPLPPKMVSALNNSQNALLRARGRPNFPQVPAGRSPKIMPQRPLPPQLARANMVYRAGTSPGSQPVLVPTSYQISGSQIFQVMGPQGQVMNVPANSPAMQRLGFTNNQTASVTSNPPVNQQKNAAAAKLLNQPSISITPLPRQTPSSPGSNATNTVQRQGGGGGGGGSKTTFVICEICDGYIKDLQQLRNHMLWIHKVKIHPKMIYNRPPLNCQKCQFRFFTDQGLERHLLGSHGLVTSSMQESANIGKDGGRCPVCGRVYQWKLLNHVARDHNMTLKPAHLSYKCTVCTATFGMYKQFENHVYSAHSVVAKRVMDKKNGQSVSNVSRPDTATLLKPLKINDEITIIPQPAKKPSQPVASTQVRPVPGTSRVSKQPRMIPTQSSKTQGDSVQIIDLEDSPLKNSGNSENGGVESLSAVKERLRRRKSLEIRQVESEADHSEGESEGSTSRSKPNSANEEDEDDDMHQDVDERKGNMEEEDDDDDEEEEHDEQREKDDDGNDDKDRGKGNEEDSDGE